LSEDQDVIAVPPPRSRGQLIAAMLAAGRSLGSASSMLSHACAESLGLHATDWECVTLMEEALPDRITAGRLAELTGLTTGAITGVIDRLEASGFVRRERDPVDRRRVVLELVAERMVMARPVFSGVVQDMLVLQRDYDDAELATLLDLLTKASAILRHHALAIRAGARAVRPQSDPSPAPDPAGPGSS
jgi:DNA-binding MarR family transcriptional regulator